MRIGIVGINHKLANVQLRELLAKSCLMRFGAGQTIQNEQTFIVLSTCNRTEVYFASEDLSATHTYILNVLRKDVDQEFDQKLYSYFGYDCFMHLAGVTAGLDSAIVAETEIQGQVKSTYESVATFVPLPEELHYLFQKALRIGKQVRSSHPIQRGLPDLEHAVINAGNHFFDNPEDVNILFVGASDINQKIISHFKNKNIQRLTLCNRSPAKAKAVAESYGLALLPWNDLEHWHSFDWIIFGTKSPDPLIFKEDLPQGCSTKKLIIDLSVPRNVDPRLGSDSRVTLLNIDGLNHSLSIRRQKVHHLLDIANQLVAHSSHRYVERFCLKQKQKALWLAATA